MSQLTSSNAEREPWHSGTVTASGAANAMTDIRVRGIEEKPGSIPMLLTDIMRELDELHVSLEMHEKKIQPVLAPIPPMNESTKDISEGSPTDIGRCLLDIKSRIRSSRSYLRTMTSRCEI